MIKSIPSTWDETIVLPGSAIGEAAVYARRKGSTWFLAVMNGAKAKKLNIPLSFLGEDSYQTTEVRDTKDDTAAIRIEHRTYGKKDTIQLNLGEGGGYIARFSK
ncbi:Retaining alpha-galactosidase precursor [compost metagenome]